MASVDGFSVLHSFQGCVPIIFERFWMQTFFDEFLDIHYAEAHAVRQIVVKVQASDSLLQMALMMI